MKKFLIAICGILVVGNALGISMPKVVSDLSSTWNVGGTYNDETWHGTYSKLSGQLNSDKGTYGNSKGAIVLVMARKIYDNGGYFCATQIQTGSIGDVRYKWIDYIKDDKFFCFTVCKAGFFGASCERSSGVVAVNRNKLNFGTLDVITSGNESNIITEETEVFADSSLDPSSTLTAKHIILGMVKLLEHGIIVAPIEVVAEIDKLGTNGKIISAKSNGENTLLCRSGYYANSDNTDCVDRAQHVAETMCEGFDGFKESMHEKYQESKSSKCSKFYCKDSGYGFKSTNDKTCIECEGDALAYVNSYGLCDKCQKGEIANESRDGCIKEGDLTKYSQSEMKKRGERECWLETDPRRFAGCVIGNCSSEMPCYNSTRKSCESCN